MNETRGVDRTPSPKKDTDDKDAIDPEKFQKALKVEKSEEIDKREKRNRPKQQEELGSEEEDVGASIPVPVGLFKQYMQEDKKTSSVFDASEGTRAHLVSESNSLNSAPNTTFFGNVEEGQTSNISVGTTENSSSAPSESNEPVFTDEPPPSTDNSNSQLTLANSSQNPALPSFNDNEQPSTIAPSNDNSTNPTSSTTTPPNDETQSNQPPSVKKARGKKAPLVEKKAEKNTEQIAAPIVKESKKQPPATQAKANAEKNANVLLESTEKKKEDQPTTELKNDKKDEPLPASKEMGDSQKDSEHKDSNSNKEESVIAPISVPLVAPAGITALEMSPFSNMPKDVFELFEKMAGMMTVQKDNGKSVTTITLNMPNSVFNKAELVLEHYDTAPHSFNVQLFGSPEAIERFAKNMKGLNNSIKETKLNFSINLLPPKLSKNYVGRVSPTNPDREEQEEKDGEESN